MAENNTEERRDLQGERERQRRLRRMSRRRAQRRIRFFFSPLINLILFVPRAVLAVLVSALSFIWRGKGVIIALAVLGGAGFFLFARYASPTYYGTKIYLGKYLPYSDYTVAEGITEIKEGIFNKAKSMKSIELPEGLLVIQDYAFSGCKSLETVKLPDTLTSIGECAFWECSALQEIEFPDTLTSIGKYAFEWCSALQKIEFPDTLTSIGERVFHGCSALQEIEFPDTLTSIGERAFDGCSALQEIEFPDTLTSIGAGAFGGCTALEEVTFRSNSIDFGDYAFDNCINLRRINNEGNMADFETALRLAVWNCPYLDMELPYLYYDAIEGVPLLEDEVQLKNLLRRAVDESVQPIRLEGDIEIVEAEFGEEKIISETERKTEFSAVVRTGLIDHVMSGYASLNTNRNNTIYLVLDEYGTKLWATEKMEGLGTELEEGNFEFLLELLNDVSFSMGSSTNIPFGGANTTTIEEAALVKIAGEEKITAYRIPFKANVDNAVATFTVTGVLDISEENDYTPKLLKTEVIFTESKSLLGTYECSSPESADKFIGGFTIDCAYDEVYSVTFNGEKGILIMDYSLGEFSLWLMENGNYVEYPFYLSPQNGGVYITANGQTVQFNRVSDKVNSSVAELSEHSLVGKWVGTYNEAKDGSGVSHEAEKVILPIGNGETLTAVSFFGPVQGQSGGSGITIDTVHWNPDTTGIYFQSMAWANKPEGFGFIDLEGGADVENGTISGANLPMELTRKVTEGESLWSDTAGTLASIYEKTGMLKASLGNYNSSVPEDAFGWNGRYYNLYNDCATWAEAVAACEERNGTMAVFETLQESNGVYKMMVRKKGIRDAAFGLSDSGLEGKWLLVNGEEPVFTNWNVNEPNSATVEEDYASFYSSYGDGTWNDGAFGSGTWYICEWEGLEAGVTVWEYGAPEKLELEVNTKIPENAMEYNGHYYTVYKKEDCGVSTWDGAKWYCEKMGGHLATITSAEENEAIYYLLSFEDTNTAAGFTDSAEEGVWKWVTGEEASYYNWDRREPNNDGGEHYLELSRDGIWNDVSAENFVYFLCEWDSKYLE